MRIARLHTRPETDVFDGLRLHAVTKDVWSEYVVPKAWDDAAVAVLLEKVFCRAPLPALTRAVPEAGVPEWLWRHAAEPGAPFVENAEKDFRAVLHRIAGSWAYHAGKAGVFDSSGDARAFYDETRHLLLHRMAAPEIAVWANAGLDWAYGLPARDIAFQQRTPPPAPGKNALKHFDILARQGALDGGKSCALLPVENIDSAGFIRWKKDAEANALAHGLGLKVMRSLLHRIMDACDRDSPAGFDPAKNHALERTILEARRAGLGEAAIEAAISYTRQGHEEIPLPRLEEESADGVTAVLSVPDAFIESALTGHGFMQVEDGVEQRRAPAEKLWDSLADSVWSSGAPQVFFRDSARGSSPLDTLSRSRTGGFVFPPDSAAPSASLNLLKLDAAALAHAATLMTVALDTMAIAPLRPVVLGVTNLAGFLMKQGLAYDSDEGRATAALAVALVSGAAHRASGELAAAAGAFKGHAALEKPFLQNIRDRMNAFSAGGWVQKDLLRRPVQLRAALCPDAVLTAAAQDAWARAYVEGRSHGLRNAHLTGIDTPPDAQILLGAETRDIAPGNSLVRLENGGGVYGRRLNPLAAEALQRLGYGAAQIDDIHFHALGHGTLLDAPFINHRSLREKGFHQAALDAVEAALKPAQHIRYAFNKWTLGPDFCRHVLELDDADLDSADFDMLTALGFSGDEIAAANLYCCGAMTLDGAPHLKPRHRAVFDCRVSPDAQILMQAAVEPFLSGGAAHTVSLDRSVTIDEVQKLVLRGWELGVKSLSLYRESSSLLHAAAPATAEREDPVASPQKRAAAKS